MVRTLPAPGAHCNEVTRCLSDSMSATRPARRWQCKHGRAPAGHGIGAAGGAWRQRRPAPSRDRHCRRPCLVLPSQCCVTQQRFLWCSTAPFLVIAACGPHMADVAST